MKPLRNNIICAVNTSQKEDYQMELGKSGIKIWMNKTIGTFDGKVKNPTLALVKEIGESVDDIKPGEFVLTHHNAFERVSNGYAYGSLAEKENGLSLFSLECSMIYVRLDEHGNPHPLKDYLIIERINDAPKTFLELPDSVKNRTHKNYFKVLEAGSDCEGVKDGDTVICYTHSDYEINYTWNYEDRQCIRVSYNDVHGILN